jgi:UDP-N-acetyl-D-galactosamine dehydrogenase
VCDPLVSPESALSEYGVRIVPWEELTALDALLLAVPHKEFLSKGPRDLLLPLADGGVFMDLKSAVDAKEARPDVQYWSL